MYSDMKYTYEHYVGSSDGSSDEEDYTDETPMMQAVLTDAKRAEEHVLNLNGSTKGHRVLNRNKACGHLTSMDDYFAPDAYSLTIFVGAFGCEKMSSIASMASGPLMTTSF